MIQYKLEGKTPIQCPDVKEWAEWFENADRHVAETIVRGIRVSTVFLGIDHAFLDNGLPILFETMTFNKTGDILRIQYRYATWDEAKAGHDLVVAQLNSALPV